MNITAKKNFLVLFSLNILLSVWSTRAVITIKTSWSSLRLQVAWDEMVERSVLLGIPNDEPRILTQTPSFENNNVEITFIKPYTMHQSKKKTIYLSIGLQGASRSNQITIPVIDGATLWVSYVNQNEIAIDRPIDLVNSTNHNVIALLNRHEPAYGFVRKLYPLQDDEEPFNYQPLDGKRKIIVQEATLAPADIPFENGCLSQVNQDSLIYRLYKIRHRFMANTYSQALDFAYIHGLLHARWQNQEEKQYTARVSLPDLLPLAGEQDVIEFSNQPQQAVAEEPEETVLRTQEAIELANNRCGLFKVKSTILKQGPPYVTIHRGAQSPQLLA